MKALDISILAGGAAVSLLAGIATARLGLAPIERAVAAYHAEAKPIALVQSPVDAYRSTAEIGPIQAAVYRDDASPARAYPATDTKPVYVDDQTATEAGDVRDADAKEPEDGTRADAGGESPSQQAGNHGDGGATQQAEPSAVKPETDSIRSVDAPPIKPGSNQAERQ